MVAFILEFKERMAYYHENPNLKTGGQLYTAPKAVLELESLLNLPSSNAPKRSLLSKGR
ncbi:MAG: hypothetical protein KKF98_05760 [Bacteroidetes bacterium]|nr:hypothetical protein [Bacteroidota bacterium]